MNLYDYQIPEEGESFDELLQREDIRIVRIVSSDQVEPIQYLQEEDEWVVLLEGNGTIEMDGKEIDLKRGDTLLIPAHTPHKVLSTSQGALWLAVHIG